jgi:hypothetical protein
LTESPIRDLLDLLHEDWLPEDKRKDLQDLVIELVENLTGSGDRKGDRFAWQ